MDVKEKFEILKEFHFDVQPVGIKYLVRAPENIAALNQKMALCEMLKKAQGGPFMRTPKNEMELETFI